MYKNNPPNAILVCDICKNTQELILPFETPMDACKRLNWVNVNYMPYFRDDKGSTVAGRTLCLQACRSCLKKAFQLVLDGPDIPMNAAARRAIGLLVVDEYE